jgi:hypothetical protein
VSFPPFKLENQLHGRLSLVKTSIELKSSKVESSNFAKISQ